MAHVSPIAISITNNPALTTINLDSWTPRNDTKILFSGNALDATFVNGVLAKCVAIGMVQGRIDFSGGTNAAPTGQGLLDVTTLTTAGVTVLINP